ncbi:DUF6114 domain-containing protein [Streptomyces albidoflavus]|uniref:Membrane protein n=1 Tax=Streptomyces wadayamensis TaxID=141454 RepID=A0ABR4S2M6_9ACTN|nr:MULTISPECIES: DUF6114 domain-containing protein [Streptomyces]QLA56457.1 hypothetical protein HWN34_07740 [Streptomyces violascens]KDR59876.1 membrane protein [Streptomyces wadayamensis]MBK3381120.1 hypothetical protein [Streptomyces sp. DEF147AK]MBK3386789.1 hypothetical protein [Streptomyces sp. DEF1AK]MBV7251188.1 hypothetical protein [Streptomyces sp. S-2]
MSAESPGLSDRFHYWRLRFRVWRGSRPFWAGLLTMLGGIPIAYLPYAQLTLGQLSLRMATTAGAGSLIIGVLLVTLGLTMWFQSIVRVFAGVAAILLALVSIPVSNLGGLLIGFLLAMFGGALSISWAPGKTAPEGSGQGARPAGTRTQAEPEPAGPVVQAGAPRPEPHAGGESAPADGTTLETNGGRHRAG